MGEQGQVVRGYPRHAAATMTGALALSLALLGAAPWTWTNLALVVALLGGVTAWSAVTGQLRTDWRHRWASDRQGEMGLGCLLAFGSATALGLVGAHPAAGLSLAGAALPMLWWWLRFRAPWWSRTALEPRAHERMDRGTTPGRSQAVEGQRAA